MSILIFGSGGSGSSGGSTIDLSQDTIEPRFVLKNGGGFDVTFHNKDGELKTGIIYNYDGTVLSGTPSSYGHSIPASQNARYIPAGQYLNQNVRLEGMASGSASMSREGNVVTLTKAAGYIGAGSATETIPLYSGSTTINPGYNDITLSLSGKYCGDNITVKGNTNLIASNIKKNVSIFGVTGSYEGSSGTSVSHEAPYIYSFPNSSGKITIKHAQAAGLVASGTTTATAYATEYSNTLIASNIKNGVTIFGVTGNYSGTTVSKDVYFDGSSSVSINSQSYTVSGSTKMEMVALLLRDSGAAATAITSVVAWRGGSCIYNVPNGGMGTGSATWNNSSVSISVSNSNSWWLKGNYRVVYAYLA